MKSTEEKSLFHSNDSLVLDKSPSFSLPEKDFQPEFSKAFLKQQSHPDNRLAIAELEQKIIFLESRLAKFESSLSPKERRKKKLRRKAKEIARTFTCEINNCGRVYGSETSLKNHRKIKHGIRLLRKSKLRKPCSLGSPQSSMQSGS